MSEIQTKDKLITLEELGTAYNNITPANIGAVNKAGDTMTGGLAAADFTINGGWPTLYMKTLKNGSYVNDVMLQALPSGRLTFITHIDGDSSEIYMLPEPTSNTLIYCDILTTKSPVTIEQGGTGATGVETSRIVLHSSLSGLGIPASLVGNDNWVRRWGKLYVLTYSIDISSFTFQPSSQWIALVQDEEGWIDAQINNTPWEVDIDTNIGGGKLIRGSRLSLGQGLNYPASRIRVNITWLDPN